MNHFVDIENIKIKTKLTVEEAYTIAKLYHKRNSVAGKISEDIREAMYLDEKNFITNSITWMVSSVLPPSTFEGMDEMTIMVNDDTKECTLLDHNGIPVVHESEQPYSDDEFYSLFDEDEIL